MCWRGASARPGSACRVTAQLVNAADGYQLWSHSFDSELADVFAVQDQIASAVVAALKANVLPNPASAGGGRRVTGPEAYTHYLRGLQLYNTGSVPGLRQAIEEYEKAIAADPDYPPAHAGLALSAFLYANSLSDEFDAREWTRRAVSEADRAVELDPNDPQGRVARGMLRTGVIWDWPGAHEDLDRAIALAPGAANAHMVRAQLMATEGEVPRAIEEVKRAVELRPARSGGAVGAGCPYNSVGQYGLARQILRKGLEIAPEHGLVTRELAFTELLDGHASEALAIFKRHPQGWVQDFGTALAEHSLGNEAASKTAVERLDVSSGKTAAYQVAETHAWRGEADAAFEWLEQARQRRDPGTRYVKYDPLLRSLHSDPRYAAFLKTMKLPLD